MKRREFVTMAGLAMLAPGVWASSAPLVEVWKSDIRRLLAEKSKAIGLTAPGMPQGSPGMDVPNSPPYEVLLVRNDRTTTLFARH